MKIIYIANARIPTEKANGKQIAKTCEALAKIGVSVELWLPDRKQPENIKNDLFDFYNLKRIFRVKKISTIDLLPLTINTPKIFQILAYLFQEASFDFALATQNFTSDVIYTRSITAAIVVKLFKNAKVFYEIHNITESQLARKIHKLFWRQFDGLVVISHGLKKALEKEGLPSLVAEDAVDLEEFSGISKISARKKLHLDLNKKLIIYTGSLYVRKGVYILADAAKKISDSKTQFIFVGGTDGGKDVLEMQSYLDKNKIKNVVLTGFISPKITPYYLRAADILALPNSAKVKESREYTSPMKLFEYLAADRPILASSTSANCEVLRHNNNAYLVKPDSSKDLVQGLKIILDDQSLAKSLGTNAAKDALKYSWEKRTEKILKFITKQ